MLIRGCDVVGFFADEHEALDLGYERFEGVSFMVKQVKAVEPVIYMNNVFF